MSGKVTLTSVPILINQLFAPHTGTLLATHPALDIELAPQSHDSNLVHREADLAIRLARPTAGGNKVKMRRAGTLRYAVYCACTAQSEQAGSIRWISYSGAYAHLPQAKWIEHEAQRGGHEIIGLRVHDTATAIEAVAAGYGVSLLPEFIADKDERLVRATDLYQSTVVTREIWLLFLTELTGNTKMQAVINWVDQVLEKEHLNQLDQLD